MRCGLAFNPKTAADDYAYLAEELDGLLFLSVEPDGAGETFIPHTYEKVRRARALFPAAEIWVDGNVTTQRLKPLHESGATHAVLGRAFFQ